MGMENKKDQDTTKKTVEFNSSYAFLMVPAGAAHDKKLLKKPKAILLLGEIISMLNVTQSFYASNREMAKRLNCDPRTIQDYLNFLEKEKLIVRDVERTESGEVKGRKIYAGEKLGDLFTQGWKIKGSNSDNKGKNQPHVTDNTTPSRYTQRDPHVTDNTTPTLQTTPKYNSKIEQVNKTITTRASSKKQIEKAFTEDFEKVWSEYPKKQGKKDALRHYIAWRKASKDNNNEFLLKKLNEYKKYIQLNNIEYRFIKNGSTWFNGGYEDDYNLGAGKQNENNLPENYGYDELFGE